MKVSIIGAGNVGAAAAFLIVQRDLADVVLLDIQEGLPQGKALDMNQASSLLGFESKVVGTSDYEQTKDSEVVVLTAGFPRSPGMSRQDLLKKNSQIVKTAAEKIAELAPSAKVIVVTNPLDLMTYLCFKVSGFARQQVLGMGSLLDGARFRHFLASETDKKAKDISAQVIGSHDDLMVPLPRLATTSGSPIANYLPNSAVEEAVARTKNGGAAIVSLLKTSSAFYAPAAGVYQLVRAVLQNTKEVFSVCACLEGEYGLSDVAFGVPAKVGQGGIEEIVQLDLALEERKELERAAAELKKNIAFLDLS